MKQLSLLVVDDEPDNFDVIETLLGDGIYQLHYAANGRQALDSLDSYNPDLILLDVMMPEVDGIEVCRQIKSMPKWQSIPIVMVTALTAKSDLANCLNAGADDFISKPVNAIELRARVNSMLRIKQQYDNIQALSGVQERTIHLLENSLKTLRGNLVSSLPHELNTPLNGILSTVMAIEHDLENMEIDELREMLGWIDRSARRLEQLTKKFLFYLDLEIKTTHATQRALVPAIFSSEVLTVALTKYASQFNRADDLVFAIQEAELQLPERYLLTMLNELVDNAIKFSTPGTPIKVGSNIVNEMLCFSVTDQGRGMTDQQIAQIGAFMQFDRKRYEQQGMGLGLVLAQKIAEFAGGYLLIRSVPQQSTTIKVFLPIATENDTMNHDYASHE